MKNSQEANEDNKNEDVQGDKDLSDKKTKA